ncbi:hypothetical protein PENSPDRAFT_652364 [Peniophora sp. CONT]|nr:hypothetical protein PENSPDRAFT_652364 [Peniophora sp. CONT]
MNTLGCIPIRSRAGPDLPKGVRVEIPTVKYAGEDDFDLLKDWVTRVVDYVDSGHA